MAVSFIRPCLTHPCYPLPISEFSTSQEVLIIQEVLSRCLLNEYITAGMICQLLFIVCLLCAKHHVGAVPACVLRERDKNLKYIGHSPSRNIKSFMR